MKEVDSLDNILPKVGETLVLDAGTNFGGAAINVAIHLGLLGFTPELWGSVGAADADRLHSKLSQQGVECRRLETSAVGTDLIMALKTEGGRSGVYVRQGNLNYAKPLSTEALGPNDIVAFCGSRHPQVRRVVCALFCSMQDRPQKPLLCFTPSYSIFDFDRDGMEVSEFVQSADVLFFNEYEVTEVCKWLGKDVANLIAEDRVLVVTLSDQGALLYHGAHCFKLRKLSGQWGDILGTGDAFTAGFLAGWIKGESIVDCGWRGAAHAAVIANRNEIRPSMPGSDLRNAVEDLLTNVPERSGPSDEILKLE